MDLGSWLEVLAAGAGATVAIYGLVILLTDRATPADRRAFRSMKDAGLYYACFGLALTLLMLGVQLNEHQQSIPAVLALAGTMILTGLAVIRYRPRRNNSGKPR
jgi:hypothetical protein